MPSKSLLWAQEMIVRRPLKAFDLATIQIGTVPSAHPRSAETNGGG
jgi:hypothetical protein